MGWFNKKKKEGMKEAGPLTLPELPKLPEFPKLEEEERDLKKPPHQLPSFPSGSLGDKFSQHSIKEAVTGKKEDEEVFDADDFAEDDMQMMQKPLRKPLARELSVPGAGFRKVGKIKAEPVFIRIDKFEESLQVFEKAKNQIAEIEKMLREIRKTKTKEEEELGFWEKEMQEIKRQVEKVDQDIFSKVE